MSNEKTFDQLAGERYEEKERRAMEEVMAMSPEELAKSAETYPKDRGGWTKNPYLD